MSELKKWRVTGPYGFNRVVEMIEREGFDEDLAIVHALKDVKYITLALKAGYRAEPIEEPRMVTVRAEDVETLIGAEPRSRADVHDAFCRLRAALESAK